MGSAPPPAALRNLEPPQCHRGVAETQEEGAPQLSSPLIPPPSGATSFGSHFHSQFDSCQRKWFFSKRAPHPTIPGAVGLRPSWTSEPLLIGDMFHIGMANYYASGATDGNYDVAAAVTAAESAGTNRKGEWRSSESFGEAIAKVRSMLWGYDDFYGAGASTPDYPNLSIYCDAEGPVIERELKVEVAKGMPAFTCRVDALVKWNGWLWVFEHKTTSASSARSLQSSMRTSIQGTGECWVLSKLFPELPIQGVLLNVVVKDRGARSKEPSYFRDPIARTTGQLEQFEYDLRNRWAAMERARESYERWLDELGDPWAAARRSYIASGGSNGHCTSYGRSCEFIDLCASSGQEHLFAQGFDAASTPSNPEAKELASELEP